MSEIDGRSGWRNVVAGFASMFTVFGVAYSFGSFFVPMAEEFGASRTATSAVFSITAFLYFSLGVISGPAVDRFGPRPVLVAGAVAMGVGLALTSFVERLWVGYVTYGLGVGIGVACGYVPMLAAIGGWFARRRSIALGIAVAGIGLGTLTVAPLAAALIEANGWRSTYRAFAVASTTALLACAVVVRRPPAPRSLDLGAPSPLRTEAFAVMYVSGVLLSLALFLVFIFLVPFAEENGVGKVAAAALVGVVGAASIVGRLVLGLLADRVGAIRMYRACFFVIALSYTLWLAGARYGVLLGFAVLFGAAYGGFIALSPAVVADLFGTGAMGRVVGVLYTSAAIGALVGPPLAGVTIDVTGSYRWAITAAMLLAFSGWLVLARLRPRATVPPSATSTSR